MSGIYIPGMEMPVTCCHCPLMGYDPDREWFDSMARTGAHICVLTGELIDNTKREEHCPLIPVPPHGRLIDADAFIKQKTEQICKNCDRRRGMKDGKLTKRFVYAIGDAPCRACDTGDMLDYVDDAPTIIPAEEGEG